MLKEKAGIYLVSGALGRSVWGGRRKVIGAGPEFEKSEDSRVG